MTVGSLLRRISSREITEWQVHETEVGQLGPDWEREVLAQILEGINSMVYLMQQGKGTEPRPVPRPNEYMVEAEEPEERDVEWQP